MDLESLSRCFADFPDPVVVADNRRRIVYLNLAAEHLLGYSLGKGEDHLDCSHLIQMELQDQDHCFIDRCLRLKEALHRVPVCLQNRHGERFNLSVTTTPLKNDSGDLTGCFAILMHAHANRMAHSEIQTQINTLSSILKHYPVPFFTVDTDLVITYMNKPLEKLSGYTYNEVVGRMTCAEVLSTPQCNTDDCLLMQSMQKTVPVAGVRRMIKDRQGRKIPVVANASVITDSSGKVIGGFEAIRDITPIVEAEEKIKLLTEMTQEGILMVDENRRVIFANTRMGEIVGRPKEDLIGIHAGEVLPFQLIHSIADLVKNVDQQLHHQQTSFCGTLPLLGSSRERCRTFETCMAASRVGKGVITYLYFRDLTERIRIEHELRKANSFLNNIIRSSVDGIIAIDTKGRVLIFNEGAERILGYTAEEALADPGIFGRCYAPELAREMMRRMRSDEYGPPGKLDTTRVSFTNKNGEEVPVNFSAAIIKEGSKEIGSVGIFSDLREHLRMHRELEEAHLQVVQAEKIASLGRLAAGVAHEINNPLAGILIYADMLMKEISHNPQWLQDMEVIIHQTLRCKEIVTRLLEFSRQSLGQRVLFDANEIIRQSVVLLNRQTLFQDIEMISDLAEDLPYILGDPSQLQQVFTNLLINAADAMHGKGRITISSQFVPKDDTIILKFTDTGTGINSSILDKIFEPFFTTKPPGKGTGLGLSIAYGVIQRHGGSIEVESSPGVGTTFIITLPLVSPEESVEMIET